jgi:predicted metalloprotease with PDZ domain
MFDVRKPTKKPIVVIRAATGNELSNYEKRKLANIEENAQENKIEVIRINDQRLQVDPINKEVRIELGNLAFKSKVTPNDVSADELFFIKCELDEEIYKEDNK